MIRFGPWSIILLLGCAQGFFVAIGLLLKTTNRSANRFLAGLIALLALKLVPYVIGYAGFYIVYPWLDLAPFDLGLGFGPLVYLYVVRLTADTLPTRWKLHLLPLALQLSLYGGLFIQPIGFKRHFEDSIGPAFSTAENLLTCLSFSIYLGLTWKQVAHYEQRLGDRFANPELHRRKALRMNLGLISVALLSFVAVKIWKTFVSDLTYYQMFPFYLLLTAVVYAFGFNAFKYSQVEYGTPIPSTEEPRETDWSALAARYTAELESRTFWRDPQLSVVSAAQELETTEARLSKALNAGLGLSFSAWINRYRIGQVAGRLLEADGSESVIDIAEQCGFNSKATFNRWFRTVKGCTPTEFRRAQLGSAPSQEPGPAPPKYPPALDRPSGRE